MRLNQKELILVGVIIVYIAFFTHPPPTHIQNFLETPIGHIVALLGVLYVVVYQSLLVGVFLGIAYIMTAGRVTEYMDPKEQKPKVLTKKEDNLASEGIPPPPAVTGSMKKGDTRLPQTAGKDVKSKPPGASVPKGSSAANLKPTMSEPFSNF